MRNKTAWGGDKGVLLLMQWIRVETAQTSLSRLIRDL